MPKYKYVATDPAGANVTGVLDAPSPTRARSDLIGRDFADVQVKERKAFSQIEITPKKLKPADLMVFDPETIGPWKSVCC